MRHCEYGPRCPQSLASHPLGSTYAPQWVAATVIGIVSLHCILPGFVIKLSSLLLKPKTKQNKYIGGKEL